jgi:hypothetical protein
MKKGIKVQTRSLIGQNDYSSRSNPITATAIEIAVI